MKPKTVNLIQLNIAVMIWGVTAMFAKGVALPTLHITCIRSLVAAMALLAFLVLAKSPFRIRRMRHYGLMFILGLLLCLHWLTFFQGMKISTSTVVVLAMHTYPVITALVEPFVFHERLRKMDIVLAVVVFTGVLIMTPEINLSNSTTMGILLGVVSGIFFLTRNLMVRKYVREYSGSALMFWQVLVAGVLLLPVLAISGPVQYTPKTLGLLALLGVVFTALPQTLFAASFKHLSAKTVGILATLLPFYTAFWGYLIHDERITVRTAVGGLLILVCIIAETTRNVRSR